MECLETRRKFLKKLTLNSLHIGIGGASRFHWHDLPELWPNLESLIVSNYSSSFRNIGYLRQMGSAVHVDNTESSIEECEKRFKKKAFAAARKESHIFHTRNLNNWIKKFCFM